MRAHIRPERHAVGAAAYERFEQLYGEHHAAVRSYAIYLTGSRHHADDLVQETFIRAWRNIDGIDGANGSVRAWLYMTLRRIRIDAWRKSNRELPVAELPEPYGHDPHDDLLLAQVMDQALERVSGHHRSVLKRAYYAGMSVAETADHLGIALGTVKSRTYYGLRSLKSVLEELGISERDRSNEPCAGRAR